MITKEDRSGGGFLLGLVILAIGVGIGMLLQPERWFTATDDGTGAVEKSVRRLHPNLTPPADPAEVPDNGLDTISLTFDDDASRVLQRVRDRAMERGMIVQTDEDTVDGIVRYGAKEIRAEIRIKGDWTDHVAGDKWSYRINLLDDKLMGMRVFSVQAPKTRGFLWEWLVLEASRREGVLAPRATFVNVVVNDNDTGIYYLEEHFSKELLESQGRREGPIVLWDESTLWDSLLQAHNVPAKGVELPVPGPVRDTLKIGPAFIRAYGEKRLGSSDALNRSFYSAIEQMTALQNLVRAATSGQERLKRIQALADLKGATIDSLMETDRLASAHALASLFQIEHALTWHNMRFYHDPVLDRLEPIMFDNNADYPGGRDPVVFRAEPLMAQFATSDRYYVELFRDLGRFCQPDYLDELFGALDADLRRFEAALNAEQRLESSYTVDSMLQRLRTQQAYLRTIIYPVDPLNVMSFYELVERGTLVSGTVEVTAWSTTRVPVVVDGFRFSNGAYVPALSAMAPDTLGTTPTPDEGVVLPRDGRPARFRFSMDNRLANLENVDQVLQAIQEEADTGGRSLDLDIDIVFRSVAADVQQAEKLTMRRRDPAWDVEQGRPEAPTLAEALERYPFLEFEAEEGRLLVREGDWEVPGDLIVPSGYPLHAYGSIRLRFEEDAVFLTDAPLVFQGSPGEPIVLEPVEGAETWKGIAVLKTAGRSSWRYVKVRNTDAVERAGWVVTGGITFYHAPVTMRDCTIEGTVAEDGTNIFGCDFLMERVQFVGCVSDSFDGDFVSGTVLNCTFRDGLADGVDFSGSDVDVIDCKFLRMGDKAVSAGEDSVVRIQGGLADRVSIGIASKDRSRVDAEGMTIRGARNYALAAFVKKPEFGPSSMVCRDLVIEGSGLGDSIVQTGCTMELDGVLVPTQDLDVGQLYEDKILGQ